MEEKEKQIEEMARLIGDSCTIRKVYVNKHYPDRQKDMYYSLAEELLKYYQPKIPKDSIIISKKEYEKLKENAQPETTISNAPKLTTSKERIEIFKQLLISESTDALMELKNSFMCSIETATAIDEILKERCGLEVK